MLFTAIGETRTMKILPHQIHVTKSFLPPIEEYFEEVKKIWNNNWLTNNGELHNELEIKLKEYLGVNGTSLFVNGTLALEIAIEALDLQGEIITTPFTFAATSHSISRNNIVPVFCDIDTVTFNLDVNKIEEHINEKTTAIMPVHVFGTPCNVDQIRLIAEKYNLKVIYDAAHAFGVEINGIPIGNFGDISMFSLHATKVYHSIEGGLLTYKDNVLKSKFNLLKNFGIVGPEQVDLIGTNAKMNEFQAAMGIINLRYIENEIAKRKKIAYQYRQLLSDVEGIKFQVDIEGIKHNYSYFPIVVNEDFFGMDRNLLHEKLSEFNVFTRKYFYPLCSNFHFNKKHSKSNDLSTANKISNQILTLPIYGSLSEGEIEYICDSIKYIQKKHSKRAVVK
jgi:dTDP-4-amino-4,6-dideoxygalactose transaminase